MVQCRSASNQPQPEEALLWLAPCGQVTKDRKPRSELSTDQPLPAIDRKKSRLSASIRRVFLTRHLPNRRSFPVPRLLGPDRLASKDETIRHTAKPNPADERGPNGNTGLAKANVAYIAKDCATSAGATS